MAAVQQQIVLCLAVQQSGSCAGQKDEFHNALKDAYDLTVGCRYPGHVRQNTQILTWEAALLLDPGGGCIAHRNRPASIQSLKSFPSAKNATHCPSGAKNGA